MYYICLPLTFLLLSIINAGHSYKLLDEEVDLLTSLCPTVIGCECVNEDPTQLLCDGITSSTITEIQLQYPRVARLKIRKWSDKSFNISLLNNLTSLTELHVINSWVTHITGITDVSGKFPLRELSFNNNRLSNWTEICQLSHQLPSLEKMWLNKNLFTTLSECENGKRFDIKEIHLNYNEIWSINWGRSVSTLESLSLDGTSIISLESDSIPSSLHHLSLVSTPLQYLDLPPLPHLRSIDLSHTKLKSIPHLNTPLLQTFTMNANQILHCDILSLSSLSSLTNLSLEESTQMRSIYGHLPSSIQSFSLTHSLLTSLHPLFFRSSPSFLNISHNDWSCSSCFLQWTLPLKEKHHFFLPNCTPPQGKKDCTTLEVAVPSRVSVINGGETFVQCHSSNEDSIIEWWLYRPATFIGRFDGRNKVLTKGNGSDIVQMVEGGSLHVKVASRDIVERYICIARLRGSNETAQETTVIRLNFSAWYSIDILDSVFWGCLMSATLACAASFLLNITWILSRKSILWWIQRAERLSRVRKMVEAIEKYRQRQMDTIHDNYNKKVQTMRDTYHQQVDQLRVGYSSQVERFRDYRTAQMENVHSHLETLRDNYQQQLHRAREYGSRRAEMLWESYERQMNRVRMFNLQSRLKMMRQYNLKQRYINKLFESFQKENADAETMRKHEEEVRAVLNMADDSQLPPLSRSSSFYSLPEYIVDKDGNLRPSPLVPSSSSPPIPFNRPNRSKDSSSSPPPGPSTAL
ncbi:iglr-2 [Pristionchus pacificus]|uniref:Ig-like domain-containing protein n=1 Tax=Pristionchus pacificus TaxID=54126 RepID=A0A8R1UTQ8_PRIPA|nr:iglr-2 [Pristionchus pacificus]